MDATTYADLQTRIACGELDCLKNCCDEDSLLMLRDLLQNKSQKDLGLMAKMLCGCATPKGPSTPTTQQSPCVQKIAKWVRENRLTINLAQTALDVAEGLVGNPKIALAIGALSSSLEAIEDLAISSEGTPADEIIDHACLIALTQDEIIAGAKDLAPEILKPLIELLQKLGTVTSLGCCPDLPAVTRPGGGLPKDAIPISLPEVPTTDIPVTQEYYYAYNSDGVMVRQFNPNFNPNA
jgi:hypothetical protein